MVSSVAEVRVRHLNFHLRFPRLLVAAVSNRIVWRRCLGRESSSLYSGDSVDRLWGGADFRFLGCEA